MNDKTNYSLLTEKTFSVHTEWATDKTKICEITLIFFYEEEN